MFSHVNSFAWVNIVEGGIVTQSGMARRLAFDAHMYLHT